MIRAGCVGILGGACVCLALFSGTAAADTLTVDTNAAFVFFGGMAGGSLHGEHRVTPADGITLRAQGDRGEFRDGGAFTAVFGLVGFRHHWDPLFLELEVGYFGIRHDRTIGDFEERLGARWYHLPDGQITFGGRVGPVELGVWTNIPAFGLGLTLGVAIDR